MLPAPTIDSLAQMQAVFAEVPLLLLDATKRPQHRPWAVGYSGKKRRTRKNTLIADPTRYSHYLGPTTCGSTHDYQLLKNEFAVNLGLLDLFELLADLGYLTDAQRTGNAAHARRVKVEHAISGAKRLGCGIWNWHLKKQRVGEGQTEKTPTAGRNLRCNPSPFPASWKS